ncbi:MAG: PhnD/SsuA/transferrin family substrate-binding protein [Bacillota bacterium]|nr:PhnD/SsuA/transferrin family substrate-binding protein [Bacillota bacterium]
MKQIQKQKLWVVLLLAVALLALGACQSPSTAEPAEESEAAEPAQEPAIPESEVAPNVLALKGPTGVGMAKMAADGAYSLRVVGSPDEVVAALTSGEADIAAMPSNLAAKLYHKTEGQIVMLAITTYGSLYLLENGDSVDSIEDLRGQTVYATGQGANPQYILEYLLRAAGLYPGEDVEIVYKSEHSELAALMAEGEVVLGMLPEPNVTVAMSKNPDLRIALDLNQEWQNAAGGQLTMSCVAVRRAYLEANPVSVQAFLTDLQVSIEYAQNNIAETAELCAALEIIPSASLAEQAIPNCALTYLSGAEMEPAMRDYYQVLLDADPSAIGGALPAADFYYQPAQE